MAERTLTERIVNRVVKLLLHLIFKFDENELRKIPKEGAAILISNHTTNIEPPALYVLIQPRKTTGLGKIELWQNRVTRFLMNTWGIIPVRRGEGDPAALRASLRALASGALLGVAPEGTRSRDGSLTRAHRGAAMLAARSGAPVYPAAQLGFRDMMENLKKLRRTHVTIRVGRPFVVRIPKGVRTTPSILEQIADEMMYQIAQMLPTRYRGEYSDFSAMTTNYLEFR